MNGLWVAFPLYKLKNPEETGYVKSIALDNKWNGFLYFSCEFSPVHKIRISEFNEESAQLGGISEVARGLVVHNHWNCLMYCDRAEDNIRRIDLTSETVSTMQGIREYGEESYDDAKFFNLSTMIMDLNGFFCIADDFGIHFMSRMRNVRPLAGVPNGSGVGGYQDGTADEAAFGEPTDMAPGKYDKLYITDSSNHCIRQIEEDWVSTLTGTPNEERHQDGTLEEARFTYPHGLACDETGNLFVCDMNTIRKIDLRQETVSTIQVVGTDCNFFSCIRFDVFYQNVYIAGDTGIFHISLLDQPRLVAWVKWVRYLWIGHLKESDCIFATLPKELIKEIAKFMWNPNDK